MYFMLINTNITLTTHVSRTGVVGIFSVMGSEAADDDIEELPNPLPELKSSILII